MAMLVAASQLGQTLGQFPLDTVLALGRRQRRAKSIRWGCRRRSAGTLDRRSVGRVGVDASRAVGTAPDPVARIHRALSRLRAEQAVPVLELFQPGTGQHLLSVAVGAAAGASEKEGLLFNLLIIQWESLALVVSGPVRQGLFDIRHSAFSPLDGRPTAIVRVKIFFLLAQDLGDSTKIQVLERDIFPS